MVVVPDSVLPLFLAAGWYSNRRVVVCFDRLASLRSYSMAAELLETLGGLHIGTCGPGRHCATSDIEFTLSPSIDHRYAVGEMETPGDDLFPLGEAHKRHMELFLDARGRLMVYGVQDGSLSVRGDSFAEGIERMLLGQLAKDCA
ncbi:MAG: SUKH-3 domain-containing protein [Pirellulaceae bacterium]